MLDGDGRPVFSFADMDRPGHFSVPVPPAQDGRLWLLDRCNGRIRLMTVPPCLAPSAQHLLLPEEVVRADTGPR